MTALKTLVSSAVLGAAAMYVLDPDRGRRRRAIARDKARRFVSRGGDLVDAARRDAAHRLHAISARARQLRDRAIPSDAVLVERVRARLGRVVAHPHAVRVAAEHGRVRLIGPILRREHAPLVAAVRAVRGVTDVDDEALQLHERTQGVSALQGNARRDGMRPELLQDNWTPALRLGAIGGGGLLALGGLRCSGLSRLALTLGGVALLARGAINMPFGRMLGIDDMDSVHDEDIAANDAATDDWSTATPTATPSAGPDL